MRNSFETVERCIPHLVAERRRWGWSDERIYADLQWWTRPEDNMPDSCQTCGSDQLVDVMVLSSAGPITQICTVCGASDRPGQPMHFRPWRGQVVQMVDPRWETPSARVIEHPGEVTSQRPPVITVFCGPPADRPYPPTPEEILSVAAWLTAPGPGRADLSDHRMYVWETA